MLGSNIEISSKYSSSPADLIELFVTSDVELSEMMVMISPLFMTPQELLDHLLDRFGTVKNDELTVEQIRYLTVTRILNLFLLWSKNHWEDFNEKMQFTLGFIGKLISLNQKFVHASQVLIERSNMALEPHYYDWGTFKLLSEPIVEPVQNLTPERKFNWLADLDTDLIAEQLTAAEWQFFIAITVNHFNKPRDMLQFVFGKRKVSNSLSKAVDHFNFISSMYRKLTRVATLILIQDTPEYRCQVITKFIKIARHLRACNNYHTLMAVLNGLEQPSIRRLAQTQNLVSKHKFFDDFVCLKALMSEDQNYSLYRASLDMSNLPCIPYIGLFTKDMVKVFN